MGPKSSKSEIINIDQKNDSKKSSSTKVINLQKQLNEEKFSLDDEHLNDAKNQIVVPKNTKKEKRPLKFNFEGDFGGGFGTGEFKINLTPAIDTDEVEKEENKENKEVKEKVNKSKTIQTDSIVRDINQFSFIKVIGKGTFGKVILAKNKENNELYALKCVKKDYIIKTKNVGNLKNEKKLLEKINNPFIIKLHFTFQNKEKIFFAFTYCNGGELFFHLAKNRRFKEDYVRIYAAEIYIALKYLHEKNIIYRDLKPENIILDKTGHIKIIDFGLAKDNTSLNNLTGSICGTNEYIPPEVISGKKYSYNFDWWGFGVIIYELLYGFPPFVDNSKTTLFRKIKESEPNYEATRVSKEAKNLMQQLLKKDLKKRIPPEEIPNHPWFKVINFDDVRDLLVKPPFVPKTKDDDDLSNIDPIFLNENIYSPVKKRVMEVDQKSFVDF